MHYNHTQTNEPPPPLLCTLSLSQSPDPKFFITRRFHLNLLAVYSHQRKTMPLANLSFKKKNERVCERKVEKGRTKVTLDDLGDQGGVGESHSLERLGVLKKKRNQVSHL